MRFTSRTSRRQFLKATSALASVAIIRAHRTAQAAEGDLIVRSQEPYNAEPPLIALVADGITPVKRFYVRNHGPMPKVDAASHKLRVEGLVDKPLDLTLAEIKERFRQLTAEATLTCAGNRRQELSAIKPVAGVQWDAGAIGHARWTGTMLSEVLKAAGIQAAAKHVWFEGLDPIKEKDGSVAPFGGSIPLDRSHAEFSMISHAMNDEPLTPEHGFPLRVIVPGYIGARSVKWLTKITVSDRPSPNHYVAEAYKLIQTDDKDEVARAEPIYGFALNAAICAPAAGAKLKAGRTMIGGYALPGEVAGNVPSTISKVEVSGDGGRKWTEARLIGKANAVSWQQWTAELDLPPGKHDLVVRATDSRGNTMPELGPWNLKGYLYNGWHHVSVEAI
jgi:sulfite oxidase